MANLNQALQQLRQEHQKAQQEVQKLQSAISAIEDLSRDGSASGRRSGGNRVVSATARARMAAAQRARWAKVRGHSGGHTRASKSATASKRSRLSPAARRKIAAAQKARWARFRAEQSKKAA